MRYIFLWLEHSIFFCSSDLEKFSRALVAFCPIFYPAAQRLFFFLGFASNFSFSRFTAVFSWRLRPRQTIIFPASCARDALCFDFSPFAVRWVFCGASGPIFPFPYFWWCLFPRHNPVCPVWRTRVASTLDFSPAASGRCPAFFSPEHKAPCSLGNSPLIKSYFCLLRNSHPGEKAKIRTLL